MPDPRANQLPAARSATRHDQPAFAARASAGPAPGVGARRHYDQRAADAGRAETAEITIEADAYRVNIDDSAIISAPRQASRDIRRHKASHYPGSPPPRHPPSPSCSSRPARRGLATSSRLCRSARADRRPALPGASQGSRAGRNRSAAPIDRAARRRSPHLRAAPRSRGG
jgi:hypothetical protein